MRPDHGARRSASRSAGAVRAHLWVRGVVQGVGFRFFVERRARALGLGGFVRNLRDGRVELAAEGPAEAVDALVEAVREGPAGAVVQDMMLNWEPPEGDAAFVISGDDRA